MFKSRPARFSKEQFTTSAAARAIRTIGKAKSRERSDRGWGA
ncbi:hypothetical protein NJ7G_3469 [Natrinema sp. J7-2]|nr:hypothetical protein NJ7G_3469 [Natrinema sp. J7-2]